MRIFKSIIIFALFLQSSICISAEITYQVAEKIWQDTKSKKSYGEYASEFVSFNNYYRLDEKNGCYKLGPEKVTHFLIIAHNKSEKYAVIQSVVSNVDTEKSRCFRNTYKGLQVKVPPYFPFIFQMDFGS